MVRKKTGSHQSVLCVHTLLEQHQREEGLQVAADTWVQGHMAPGQGVGRVRTGT